MTIKDLAVKTGYAVGTVSRALNGQPNVSEKARAAILQAARECGFELNVNAKQLKQHISSTILVIVKGTQNEFFGEMVETTQNLIASTRYQLVVDYMDEDLNEVHRAIQLCREKKPLGILFFGGNTQSFIQDFHRIDIPCVLVTGDASQLPFKNLSSVSTDDMEAARSAINLLISLGHKQIGIIGGDQILSDISRLRYKGCLEAFRENGLTFDVRNYQGGRYSYEEGYKATQTLLRKGCTFTAIFAMSDVMSIGAIRALKDANLRVPEDVSVMGVDGLSLGGYIVPQLSTIRQATRQIAERSVEILLRSIEKGEEARHERISFEVCQRESVRSI